MTSATLESTFGTAASDHGYDERATEVMVDAAASLHLSPADASEWMDADITPWGAVAWQAQGFADGHEAEEYRRWGYGPTAAYWARRDGVTEELLRQRRRLCELMAHRIVLRG